MKVQKKNRKNARQIFAFLLVLVLIFSFSSYAFAESENLAEIEAMEVEENVPEIAGHPIIFENEIHYIEDPNYPGERIPLFCMNSALHWPHLTPSLGNVQVPGYAEGYLKPSDFETEEAYRGCMRRLSKILYAGYPYNGEKLYQIVADCSQSIPTEEEFNKMLVVPAVLQIPFPYLANQKYEYADWKENNAIRLGELKKFVNEVVWLGINHATTTNGLTYEDIVTMPFYRASFCMTSGQEPLEAFAEFYGAEYFVTEKQAYDATQEAIWYLLYQYKISDNHLSQMSYPLSEILYTYSERGGLLEKEPSLEELQFSESIRFTYNPTDQLWHSTPLHIVEPEEYRGIYHLSLPKGMSIFGSTLDYIYGNKEYELICDHQPKEITELAIRAEFVWLKEMKQYSPIPDIEVSGKRFQRMVGAIVRTTNLDKDIKLCSQDVGGLSIEKQVVGEENIEKSFQFELQFPNNTTINGVYGDLTFQNGIAQFSLKAGQRLTATNLPAGEVYQVTEEETGEYVVQSTNANGTIVANKIHPILFTNSKCHNLSVGKIVKGAFADKSKKFTFVIQIMDSEGKPINETYNYIGSVLEGLENGVQKPSDGTLAFQNGIAEISLSHGQKITINHLPPNIGYVVTEKEENQDHYTTTYNGKGNKAEGTLDKDTMITVVNQKEEVPDTGLTENHKGSGFMAFVGGLGFLVFCFMKWYRRKGID